jgi:hypothetical protein
VSCGPEEVLARRGDTTLYLWKGDPA